MKIRIRQYTFDLDAPYSVGHQLTEAEATALNALRAENIRNNFSPRVLEAIADCHGNPLPGFIIEGLQSALNSYSNAYRFSTRRLAQFDSALAQMALEIAMEQAPEGTTLGQLTARAQNTEVQDEARHRLAQREAIARVGLEALL